MKRLALASIIVMLAVMASPAVAIDVSGTFTDDDGNVHEPAIQAIAEVGVTAGCGIRLYCPDFAVSRAEMATFLTRALGLTPLATGPFVDTAGSIHAGSINAIAAAGITSGCGDGRYCPNDPVRRDQMATFLARAFDLAPTTSSFSDTAGNPHEADIGAIAAAGITAGCAPGAYCPADPVRRDQMATFLARGLGLELRPVVLPLWEDIPKSCTKDGLLCNATVTVPSRPSYQLAEGFYNVLPFQGTEETELRAAGTRVEITVNGVPQSLSPFEVETGGRIERRFRGTVGFAPGTHEIVVRWLWNGSLTQTSVVTLVVSG